MKRTPKAIDRRTRQGAIAVEAALMLPILVLFLGLPSIVLAFYIRQYSAAQKAVHDAAVYLATAPRSEMTTSAPDGFIASLTVARNIVEQEMAGIVPDGVPVDPAIFCIYLVAGSPITKPCTATLVKDVNHTLAHFDVSISIPFINPITHNDTGLLMSPYASVRYVGN